MPLSCNKETLSIDISLFTATKDLLVSFWSDVVSDGML